MRNGLVITLAGLFSVLAVGSVRADFISDTLGTAGPGNFAVLATAGSGGFTNSSDTGVTGNIGIANPNGVVNISGGGGTVVTGTIYLAGSSASAVNIGGNSGNVTIMTNQSAFLTAASNAAVQAASTFSGLTPTQTFSSITSATTINPTVPSGQVNVVNIPGGINLNQAAITLTGPKGTQYVLNVGSTSTFNGGSQGNGILLSGGLTASDVVINATGAFNTTGGGNAQQINGIVLDLNGQVGLHPGGINGELIVGAGGFTTSSGALITGVPPSPPPTVPAPSSLVLMGLGGLVFAGLMARSRRLQVAAVAS